MLPAAIGLAALAAAASAAGSSSGWNRISGPTQPGSQLGLARTADGVLHVIWNRGAQTTSIFETRLSATGKTLGTSSVATGWQGNGGRVDDAAHGGLGSGEKAENDLVGAHQYRAEVANVLARVRELGHHHTDPFVQRLQISVLDAGPEALRYVLRLGHVLEARSPPSQPKEGIPYETSQGDERFGTLS